MRTVLRTRPREAVRAADGRIDPRLPLSPSIQDDLSCPSLATREQSFHSFSNNIGVGAEFDPQSASSCCSLVVDPARKRDVATPFAIGEPPGCLTTSANNAAFYGAMVICCRRVSRFTPAQQYPQPQSCWHVSSALSSQPCAPQTHRRQLRDVASTARPRKDLSITWRG